MKKILCPTNFSDSAANGIAYAAKLAKKTGADLTLFNVRSLSDLSPEEALMGETVNAQTAMLQLEKICQEVTMVFKVSCSPEVETSISSIGKLIAQKATDYELVVLGTNGAESVGQYFVGSDSYNIIKQLTIPAIAIPNNCVYSEIMSIVYAFDFWRHASLPLTQLIKLSKALGSKLCVLQVMEESYSKVADEEQRLLQQAVLTRYSGEVDLHFDTVHAANVTEGINGYMIKSNADLLALCSEHHGFLGRLFHKSVIKSITGAAKFPVLVFHA